MLILQNLAFRHSNKDLLFSGIDLTISRNDKLALTGNNGSGKSTLLQLIAGKLLPSSGIITTEEKPFYIPQVFSQYDELTVAQALQIEQKINALQAILAGDTAATNLALLDDDWMIEERCAAALAFWGLKEIGLHQKMATLSGGQKTKVFLAGIAIHNARFILMDEPTNHLDAAGRKLLYDLIQSTAATLLVVSHDRTLLNLLPLTCELSSKGIAVYGGNYTFYKQQKAIAQEAFYQELKNTEKALRKAKEKERETMERQQRSDARGKQKQEKAGVARIMMNTMRNKAENSTAKAKSVHAEKINGIVGDLRELRSAAPAADKMKLGFTDTLLHEGRLLFKGDAINYAWHRQPLWNNNLDIELYSGERIAIKGINGSGKTTLIKLITGDLQPQTGTVYRADIRMVYIDQDYSLINNRFTVYQQAQHFNTGALQEHEIKTRLNRFLFTKNDWDKPCAVLSGGERMRLLLCCLTIHKQQPDLIILDEPTNNLDLQNIEILTAAIINYKGTLLVISHDEIFLEEIGIERVFELSNPPG